LVLTLKVEVCGRNCVYGSTSEEEEGEGDVRGEKQRDGEDGEDGEDGRSGKREQGFVANLRDLDDAWVCPCCEVVEEIGVEKGKRGKRCVPVLDVDVT
jgi:rubredoxin